MSKDSKQAVQHSRVQENVNGHWDKSPKSQVTQSQGKNRYTDNPNGYSNKMMENKAIEIR